MQQEQEQEQPQDMESFLHTMALLSQQRDVAQRTANDCGKQVELMRKVMSEYKPTTIRLARHAPGSALFALCEVSWDADPNHPYRYENLVFQEYVDTSVTPEIVRPATNPPPQPQRVYLLGPPTTTTAEQPAVGKGYVVAYKVEHATLNETQMPPDTETRCPRDWVVTRHKRMRIPIVFVNL